MTPSDHEEPMACIHCGHKQSYNESAEKFGQLTRCLSCRKRIVWSKPILPPGPAYWAKGVIIDDRSGKVIGYDESVSED